MERHLLVTVGTSHTHQHAVRFVGYFYAREEKPRITILYVAPSADTSGVSTSDNPGQMVVENERLAISYKRKGYRALERAKENLMETGYPSDRISTQLRTRSFGTVLDIVQEAERGYYDAVLLGRRGLSMLEEFIEKSVSRQILKQEIDFPIWIAKEPLPEHRHVLLCADGSEQSLRMADHVGFMLQDVAGHDVTMLHVDRGKGDGVEIFAQTRAEIAANGLPAERIHEVSLQEAQIGPVILDYARENEFAVVAMGTAGAGKKSGIWPFVGSVCEHVLKNMNHLCLWVSK